MGLAADMSFSRSTMTEIDQVYLSIDHLFPACLLIIPILTQDLNSWLAYLLRLLLFVLIL
uniref:Uncharacterized protein n=1 Tax=Rhizophora mucronata TaxID=61149 RepID=A0A2P2PCZ3_RHIMU